MAGNIQPDGKNSLLGEFLLALARAPEPVQEAILLYGLRKMSPLTQQLIAPYPMLAHMWELLQKEDAQHKKGA